MLPHIVVFDSGVGGLSIVKEIDKTLGDYQLSYLFDNAFFPYGELPPEVLIDRVVKLLVPLCEQSQADLLVIACNTASTIALSALRTRLTIPVVGVVPAIKPAAELSQQSVIGLLATPATIHRHYIDRLIEQFAPNMTVRRLGSSKLVRMAEHYLSDGMIDRVQLAQILAPWLDQQQPDVVVLGCTHFPLIREPLQQILGERTQLVDSGAAIARRVKLLIESGVADSREGKGTRQAFYTEKNAHSMALQALFKQLKFNELTLCPKTLCAHSRDELSKFAAEIPIR